MWSFWVHKVKLKKIIGYKSIHNNGNPYFMAVQVDSHENYHSHENRQFHGGIVIFMREY
jgi:hypothetical protein